MKRVEGTRTSRREFIKRGGAIAASATLGALAARAYAAEDNTIKVALVGCGGRGTGAAVNALSTKGPVRLVAMADLFPDRLSRSLKALSGRFKDKVDVSPERQFLGFDAYRKAIDLLRPGDVALCTTRAYIRPVHVEYAVRKGINVFMEKPFAPDPGGLRRMLRAGEEAEKKGVKIAAGLQCRHSPARHALIEKIRNGELGEITSGSPQVVMTYQFEMPEPGCGQPVAIIHALQDTLRRWLPNDSLKMQPLDSIQWQSANSFCQHDKVYEILNPQANPYANYLFFKENSNELTGDPDQVKELCRLFLRDYAGDGAVMVLKAHINSGRGGNCGDPCEQDFSLARRRVDQAKSLLSSFGVPEQKLVDSTDSDPRFPKCIEHEFILKSEQGNKSNNGH